MLIIVYARQDFTQYHLTFCAIPGGPEKTEQSIQSIFQDFALINCYFFHLVTCRASSSHYINTKIIKFGWELVILCVISDGLSSSGFPLFSWVSRHDDKLMANPENDSPSEITYKIKSFQPNFMILVLLYWGKDALSSYIKEITVAQSKVLKKLTIPYFWGSPTNDKWMANPENDSP